MVGAPDKDCAAIRTSQYLATPGHSTPLRLPSEATKADAQHRRLPARPLDLIHSFDRRLLCVFLVPQYGFLEQLPQVFLVHGMRIEGREPEGPGIETDSRLGLRADDEQAYALSGVAREKLPYFPHHVRCPLPFLIEADDHDGVGTIDVVFQVLQPDVSARILEARKDGNPIGFADGSHDRIVEATVDFRLGAQIRADDGQLLDSAGYLDLLVYRIPDVLGEFRNVAMVELDAEGRILRFLIQLQQEALVLGCLRLRASIPGQPELTGNAAFLRFLDLQADEAAILVARPGAAILVRAQRHHVGLVQVGVQPLPQGRLVPGVVVFRGQHLESELRQFATQLAANGDQCVVHVAEQHLPADCRLDRHALGFVRGFARGSALDFLQPTKLRCHLARKTDDLGPIFSYGLVRRRPAIRNDLLVPLVLRMEEMPPDRPAEFVLQTIGPGRMVGRQDARDEDAAELAQLGVLVGGTG